MNFFPKYSIYLESSPLPTVQLISVFLVPVYLILHSLNFTRLCYRRDLFVNNYSDVPKWVGPVHVQTMVRAPAKTPSVSRTRTP